MTARLPAAVSALLSSLLVLLVADLFQPLDILAIHHIRDRDMAHTVGSGSAVPVFDTRRGPDHVARLDHDIAAERVAMDDLLKRVREPRDRSPGG